MKHSDEQTPIRERWTATTGTDDRATAGALLRAAAQHGPVADKRLSEIHARLRRSRQDKVLARPAPRMLRRIAFAAGFILCGGVLSASVMHVMRRPPQQPEVTPAPSVEIKKRAGRRAPGTRAPAGSAPVELAPSETPENPTPLSTPETAAPLPTPPAAAVPVPAPAEGSVAKAPADDSAPRLPSPQRRLALKAAPTPSPRPVSSPVANAATPTLPAPSPLLTPAAMPSPPVPPVPAERLVPTVQPPPVAPAPQAREPSRLARESRWLASAIAKLRQESAPEQALAILDQHQSELGSGALAGEANATRLEALLRLGRNAQALTLLDGQNLSARGLDREMLVARAELRANKGRTSAALHDFDLILSSPGRADGVSERALYGRATARAKGGDQAGARADFAQYLNAFPHGRFAAQARSALSQLR